VIVTQKKSLIALLSPQNVLLYENGLPTVHYLLSIYLSNNT